MARLENWSVKSHDIWQPPERSCKCLAGEVFDHSIYRDGKSIITSAIQEVNGNQVKTLNTTYILGKPNEDYVKWCKKMNVHVPTEDEPIKLR